MNGVWLVLPGRLRLRVIFSVWLRPRPRLRVVWTLVLGFGFVQALTSTRRHRQSNTSLAPRWLFFTRRPRLLTSASNPVTKIGFIRIQNRLALKWRFSIGHNFGRPVFFFFFFFLLRLRLRAIFSSWLQLHAVFFLRLVSASASKPWAWRRPQPWLADVKTSTLYSKQTLQWRGSSASIRVTNVCNQISWMARDDFTFIIDDDDLGFRTPQLLGYMRPILQYYLGLNDARTADAVVTFCLVYAPTVPKCNVGMWTRTNLGWLQLRGTIPALAPAPE